MQRTSQLVALSRFWGILLLGVLLTSEIGAQRDSLTQKLTFTGDFRFRIEHDWNSRNASGNLRADRSRLRYRFRFGLQYELDEHSLFGGRLRTGNINDQQGPHLTLGGENGEFGLDQFGLEKLYYQYRNKEFKAWIGKNSINLIKEHELFWNDNVFPEGVAVQWDVPLGQEKAVNDLQFNLSHFIIRSNNQTFNQDAYFQILQVRTRHLGGKFSLFPGLYHFRNIDNLPDRQGTFQLNYSILHLGASLQLSAQPKVSVAAEYYLNTEDYGQLDSIPQPLRAEKEGWVLTAKIGQLKKPRDWSLDLYYAHLAKFSIVDYFAQNDWARWDYSSIGASGSRLSNFRGVEIRIGYALQEKFNLILRTYFVEQLVAEGDFLENGSRIRLDLNIGF